MTALQEGMKAQRLVASKERIPNKATRSWELTGPFGPKSELALPATWELARPLFERAMPEVVPEFFRAYERLWQEFRQGWAKSYAPFQKAWQELEAAEDVVSFERLAEQVRRVLGESPWLEDSIERKRELLEASIVHAFNQAR
eukprot:6077660-Amphidinium_carterae.1